MQDTKLFIRLYRPAKILTFMSGFVIHSDAKDKQILDAGSWMLVKTLAQIWIASLIAHGERKAPGRARNSFFYPASSIAESRRFDAKLR